MDTPLVDAVALGRWLDGLGLAPGEPLTIDPLTNGRSNAMFRIDRGSHRWVLRRPALVALARADDGMRREFRLLAALDATPVPHPHPVALGDDPAVLGCVFYLMDAVDGFNPSGPLPDALQGEERAVAFALVDALAALHDVDWRAAGLDDFGRPDGFHERQVARWTAQLDSYGGRPLPELREVGAWLDAHRPASYQATIMHADYHMLNVILAPDRPVRVAAIVDWETATIGDPLLDLAGLLEVWCPSHRVADGWPSAEELRDRYAARRGLASVPASPYHVALYHFRLAVLLEGIYQRSIADPSRTTAIDMGDRALVEVALARAAIDA